MNFVLVYNMIKNTGGASFNPSTGRYNPGTGYMVGLENYNDILPPDISLDGFTRIVNEFVQHADVMELLIEHEDYYIGFWIHDNLLYIDLMENIQDFDCAYNTAFERNQLSIWDCSLEIEVEITYSPSH